jgi:hypothetical protein
MSFQQLQRVCTAAAELLCMMGGHCCCWPRAGSAVEAHVVDHGHALLSV